MDIWRDGQGPSQRRGKRRGGRDSGEPTSGQPNTKIPSNLNFILALISIGAWRLTPKAPTRAYTLRPRHAPRVASQTRPGSYCAHFRARSTHTLASPARHTFKRCSISLRPNDLSQPLSGYDQCPVSLVPAWQQSRTDVLAIASVFLSG